MIIIRQKEFARRDYEGLNNEEKKLLKKERQAYAKDLKKIYRKTMEDVSKMGPRDSITTEASFGSPHVKSWVRQETEPGWADRRSTVDLHKNGFRDTVMNEALPDAKGRMKDYARNQAKANAEVGNRVGLERAKERDIVARKRATGDLRKRVEAYKEKKAKAPNLSPETKKAVKEVIDTSYKPIYFHENGETSRIYKTSGVTKESLKEVGESIAKHEAKANELRAKKLAGEKLAKNLKKAGKVGLGVAGAAGIGYGIKKAIDKNKKKKEDK